LLLVSSISILSAYDLRLYFKDDTKIVHTIPFAVTKKRQISMKPFLTIFSTNINQLVNSIPKPFIMNALLNVILSPIYNYPHRFSRKLNLNNVYYACCDILKIKTSKLV